MAHVYACLQEFKDFLREQGSTSLGTNQDATMLGVLESASRRIDEFCGRGSGFGPRTGTNQYDASGGVSLWLNDDLAVLTSLKTRASTAASTQTTCTVNTDFYLQRGDGSYGDAPYRRVFFHGMGANTAFGSGFKAWSPEWKAWCRKYFPNSFDEKTGYIKPYSGPRTFCR